MSGLEPAMFHTDYQRAVMTLEALMEAGPIDRLDRMVQVSLRHSPNDQVSTLFPEPLCFECGHVWPCATFSTLTGGGELEHVAA